MTRQETGGEEMPEMTEHSEDVGGVHSVVRDLNEQLSVVERLPLDAIDNGAHDVAAPGTIGDGEWVQIRNGITVDSGSAAFVLPTKWLPGIPMEESSGSRSGQEFIGATGKVARNTGREFVKVKTNIGQDRAMAVQCTDVNQALACVACIADVPSPCCSCQVDYKHGG